MGHSSKKLKLKNLIFILQFLFILLPRETKSQGASVGLTSSSYSANAGSTLLITCQTFQMQLIDVVWTYYPIANTSSITVIYQDNLIQGTLSSKFQVTNTQVSYSNITSNLAILNLQWIDSQYRYQCSCNTYRTCSSGTTPTASTTITTITTTSTTTTTTTTTPAIQYCIDGGYNTAQYVLVILAMLTIIVATILFHYSFHGSLIETFFMVLAVIVTIFCLVVSLIFWINPTIVGSGNYASIVFVCMALLGCLILWILILQYVIRLCLSNELKTLVVVLICVDGVLELIAAIILIVANFYCGGYAGYSYSVFNISYLEIIASILLLIFALLLLLIAGIVFYMKKKRNDEQMLTGFKALMSGNPLTPAHFGFVAKSAAASAARPPALVQEMWFPSKKIQPVENNHDPLMIPQKPKKLTPIFSRKRGEINKVDDSGHKDDLTSNSEWTTKVTKKKLSAKRGENKSATQKPPKSGDPSTNNSRLSLTSDSPITSSDLNQTDSKAHFDMIWDPDNLMPRIEDNGKQLPTIGEEFTPNLPKSKSFLGGKIAKLDEEQKKTIQSKTDPSFTNNSKKSDKPSDMKSDDYAALVDEFNRVNQSSSSSN